MRQSRHAASLCAASLALLIPTAPGASDEQAWRVQRYPLAAFRVEHPDRVRFTEDHWPAQHIAIDGQRPRGIFAKFGGFIEYRVEDFAGAVLEGGYALVAQKASKPDHTARFRIDLQPKPGAPLALLMDEVVATGQVGQFRFELPRSLESDARLTLRIEYGQKVDPGVTPRALWIDPFFVWREKRPAMQGPAPVNVLLITADTTRVDDLGCYGGGAETPALEALGQDGTRFSRAHSVAFGTTPSHASLMTSLPAARHGVYNNWMVLSDVHETLAERLRREGYETAAFVSARPLARALGLSQGFDRYEDIFPIDRRSGLFQFALHERRGDATVDLFLDWLSERDARPFFAWVHLFDPHQPYNPPAGYLGEADATSEDEAVAKAYLFDAAGAPQLLDAGKIYQKTPDQLAGVERAARARYRAEIRFLDAQIARIRAALTKTEVYDSTLVVFAADHGENFLDRQPWMAFEHGGLHREVTHIPLIVKAPKGPSPRIQARGHELVGNIDIAPTVLSVLGLEAPASWEGQSFRDPSRGSRRHLVLEGTARYEVAVRTERWLLRQLNEPWASRPLVMNSLGFTPEAPRELYDLLADPEERKNLYVEGHPALDRLQRLLDEFVRAHPQKESHNLLDPRHRAGLKALGYVE